MEEMEEDEMKDVERQLKAIVNGSAIISVYYGGFELDVLDADSFHWSMVFDLLCAYDFMVYVDRRQDRFFIVAKYIG